MPPISTKLIVDKNKKVELILERLYRVYPKPRTALEYKNPFQLLVATILSAQATDKLINSVTPGLFKKYKNPKDFAVVSLEELQEDLSKINFYRNKAKSIREASKILVEKYKGNVPQTMEELDALPGVARKTASVVLGNAFGKAEGIVVDTHVIRLSRKLGLTEAKTPEKIEQDLVKIVPKKNWIDFSHLLINFGREFCPARPHECAGCPLGDICPDA